MLKENTFVAIDFETANEKRSSACSIGYAIVENRKIVKTGHHFIKPEPFYFDAYNTYLHGIDEDMVKDSHNIVDVWNEIYPLFEGKTIVAHNAAYDMSVLRYGFNHFNENFPTIKYVCTYKLAQKTWEGEINYKLNTLADKFNIEFNHHNAEEDSIAAAKILLKCMDHHKVMTIDDLLKTLDLKFGRLLDDTYIPFSIMNKSKSSNYKYREKPNFAKELSATVDSFDEDNEFFEKKVIFTGTLQSMSRKDASQIILNLGGIIGNGVTKDTDFLVLGEQDYKHLAKGSTMSSKMKKAYKYHEEGTGIQIISEDDFLHMIN